MRYFLLLIVFCGSGCVATAKHVDKSEKFTVDLFSFLLKDKPEAKPVLDAFKKHVDEGSSIKISPEVVSKLADGLVPGAGVLLTTLLGVYARRKHNETKYVTKQAVVAADEPDRDKAKKILSDDSEVKHFNG